MTREKMMERARAWYFLEVGRDGEVDDPPTYRIEDIADFALAQVALAVEEQREFDANMADQIGSSTDSTIAKRIAAAIRAAKERP